MIEVQVDSKELEGLIRKLEQAPDVIKDARRLAMEAAGPKLKREVDTAIDGTGKVRSWQEQYVGSRGGYVAVRPKAKTFTKKNGRGKQYAVGYVTNAINRGHRFPTPSGRNPRYEPDIRSGRMNVPGKQFYQTAQGSVSRVAQEAVEQVAQALKEHMEG